ncbi:MAG: hypothetical protein AAGA60_27395, partial [Cyanobacteria bacterium P01_E01_bin.42]
MLNSSQAENAKTRLLLFLWDLDGLSVEVKRSALKLKSSQKSKDYQEIFDDLQEVGAITVTKKGRSEKVSLTQQGLQILKERLKNPDFTFKGNQVGTKAPNALLKWMREIGSVTTVTNNTPIEPLPIPQIESYDGFKEMLLETYHRLNKDYNLGDLVPIYQLRREMG